MRRTALGVAVGVDGGEGAADFFARFLGVAGASACTSPTVEAECGVFLFRGLVVMAGGGGITAAGTALPSAWALRRADRRLAIPRVEVSLAKATVRAGCESLDLVARNTVENCVSFRGGECVNNAREGPATVIGVQDCDVVVEYIRMAPRTTSQYASR